MFEGLKKQARRAARIDDNKILEEILRDSTLQAQIVDLNQHQLYDEGIQADGEPTGSYAPITISKYKPLAAAEGRDGRTDHITGKDTGITYASMKVLSGTDAIVIHADDRNSFFDREPKGLGLTDESISEIIPEIEERMIERVASIIGI